MGYKALAKRIAANSTVDVLSNEEERNKEEKRRMRQEYVGIEPVDECDDNYKIVNGKNEFVMIDDGGNDNLNAPMIRFNDVNPKQNDNVKDKEENEGGMDYNEDILELD